jgi:hypothetical protein
MDPFNMGISVTIGVAVVGMFLRIEHRLTTVETKIDNLEGKITGCQPTSEENTG